MRLCIIDKTHYRYKNVKEFHLNIEVIEITAKQDPIVNDIIKAVGAEYGAVGEGYGPSDPEVSAMSQYYNDQSNSRYLIALVDGEVVGGCGVASFANAKEVCELKKLFLLPQSRGLGLGKKLCIACLDYAAQQGYTKCYLDTLSNMQSAIALYEKLGFKHLSAPLAGTLHSACDVWMLKDL